MSYTREISIREEGRANRSRNSTDSPVDEVSNNVFQPVERQGNFMRVIGESRPVFIPSVYPVEEPMDLTPESECVSVPRYRQSIIVHPLNIEKNRYDTFHNVWPESSPVSAQDLAKAGFKYLGPGDRVKCVFCSGILSGFEEGDTAMEEHRRHFPTCIFVCGQNVNNVPYQRHIATIQRSIPARIQSTLVHPSPPLQQPKHPQYTSKSDRLVTFNEWPSQIRQKPEDMAEAGLFYLGQGDRVKCFFCDGILHTWDPDDEPWIEHAKWFPHCEFVKVVKGEDFVSKVASGEITSEKPNGRKQDTCDSMNTKSELKDTPQVKTLLDEGNTMDEIMCALKKLGFQYKGDKLPNADVIYKAIQNESGRGGTLSRNNSSEYASLEEENRYLKEQRLCKICLENEVSVIFLPCGHVCCCGECSMSVSSCPICRRDIEKRSKAYLA